jgi:hypothetical protein
MLVVGTECGWDEFPARAKVIVDHFGMKVREEIDGLDERLWITSIGDAEFCVSWDVWIPEVSIMAWRETPDAAVEALAAKTP